MKSFTSGLLLFSLTLLSTAQGHWHGGWGGGSMGGGSWGGRPGQMGLAQFTEKWTSAGEVPAKLDSAPPAPVAVIYDWDKIMTGDTVKTENMLNPPMLKWKSERGALYTVAILDFGFPPGIQYGHWLVSNVQDAWSINWGDEIFSYIPPFGFERINDETAIGQTQGTALHDLMVLVFKQKNGRVDMSDMTQTTCDPTILSKRVISKDALIEKYNLELVAGNFFYTTYTKTTDDIICYFSKCSGAPWPYPAAGINDGPQCQK